MLTVAWCICWEWANWLFQEESDHDGGDGNDDIDGDGIGIVGDDHGDYVDDVYVDVHHQHQMRLAERKVFYYHGKATQLKILTGSGEESRYW